MKKITIVGALLGLLVCSAASHAAVPRSETKSMSFEACLTAKEQAVASLRVSPQDIIPLVNASELTITRICTAEGSVLITCSKADNKMVTTQSAYSANAGCLE